MIHALHEKQLNDQRLVGKHGCFSFTRTYKRASGNVEFTSVKDWPISGAAPTQGSQSPVPGVMCESQAVFAKRPRTAYASLAWISVYLSAQGNYLGCGNRGPEGGGTEVDGTAHRDASGFSKGFSPGSPASFPGDEDVNGKWDFGAAASLRGRLLARQPQSGRAARRQGGDAAESAPAARCYGRRGGNKGSTCLGGAAGGFGSRLRPRHPPFPSLSPPGPSSAALGARDSHAARLLLARRRRAGGERCGRGGSRGGAGPAPRVPAATARVRVPPWGAASRSARDRGRVPARTAPGWR